MPENSGSQGAGRHFRRCYYRPDPEQDRRVFEILKRHYETVFFWPQQSRDLPYLHEIGARGFAAIPPDTAAYDQLLEEEDVDFVGARLHGGIRALQYGRRALIIPVDNRAAELSVSTALPTASRNEPGVIEHWITHPRPTALILPTEAIDMWKRQFAHAAVPRVKAVR